MSDTTLATQFDIGKPARGQLRIVSLAASGTEILFALGVGDWLVGVSKYCDYPSAALEKPTVGSFIEADYEAIQNARPDLVLTQSHLQRDIVAQLIDLNINVLSLNPVSLTGVIEMVTTIGRLVDRKREAEVLASQMQARIDAVRNRSSSLFRRPRVYFEEWGHPLIPAGGWEAECVDVAGGINVFPFPANIHSRERQICSEDVIRANPELIIVSWPGSFGRIRPYKIRQRSGWKSIDAVRAGRVFVIDDRLIVRPGPRIVQGLELIAELVQRATEGEAHDNSVRERCDHEA
jgi:iron complex transport system substrate-binding protein